MCRKIMIGRSSTLKWILMLAWLGSSRCFASFKTYEVGLRAGQCQQWCVNHKQPWSVKCAWAKDCSGCPECPGEAIGTVSKMSSDICTEYGDDKCGSVCAMAMTIDLKNSYFQSKRTFQINLCGYANKCNSCFDGERCGKLCAYGGINCFDAWKRTKNPKIVDGQKQYLLNPFRTSAFCKAGDNPQCPLFDKDKDHSEEKSFSQLEVSGLNCESTNDKGKKYFSWRCDETKPSDFFKCLTEDRKGEKLKEGCTEEKPCAIKFEGDIKKKGEREAKKLDCEEANKCCHEAISCMDGLNTRIDARVDNAKATVTQCAGSTTPCLHVTLLDPLPVGKFTIPIVYSVTQRHLEDEDNRKTSPLATITLTGNFEAKTTNPPPDSESTSSTTSSTNPANPTTAADLTTNANSGGSTTDTLATNTATGTATAAAIDGHGADGSSGTAAVIAVVVALLLVLVIAVAAVIVVLQMKKKMEAERNNGERNNDDSGDKQYVSEKKTRAASAATRAFADQDFKDLLLEDDDVTLGAKFAAGGEAQIFHGTFGTKEVALKEDFQLLQNADQSIAHETALLIKMRHPHIVTFFGLWQHDDRLFMVLEYCVSDINKYMQQHEVDKPQKFAWATQMAGALAYLHGRSPPIVHRDLKPGNVLLDKGLNAKLTDFGIAKLSQKNRDVTIQMGTIAFMPPEAMSGDDLKTDADGKVRSHIDGKKWDIYSLATCYAHIFTGQQVYQGMSNDRIYVLVMMENKRPDITGVDQPIKDLLSKMWIKDFQARISAQEVLAALNQMNSKILGDSRYSTATDSIQDDYDEDDDYDALDDD